MSKFGVPTEEQLAKINKLAKRTLSSDEVFAFSGKSAGDLMIPGRYMKLSPELLKVMVEDAQKGVSFMLNHNWSNWGGIQAVPFGKVFDGRIEASDVEGETVSMFLDKFIVRDDELVDGVSANSLIKKIETGVLSDTSIGWGTDIMLCSICQKNYFGGQCKHWRGTKYEMGDGTQKVCTVTAMPPSVIIPYNNNSLMEESIVWDGAYPGAIVSQSKHGDIIELPTGKFSIVQEKEELPENTLFHGYYHNGDIITLVKKTENKKVFTVPEQKGGEKQMKLSENVVKLLNSFGVEHEEDSDPVELFGKLAEKWEGSIGSIEGLSEVNWPLVKFANGDVVSFLGSVTKDSIKPMVGISDVFMTQEQAKEKLGKELTSDEVLKLAMEGKAFRNEVIETALNTGVQMAANDFSKETWRKNFATMSIEAIRETQNTWKKVVETIIPAGRHTKPDAGRNQSFAIPDDAYVVGK